jgi:vacuole morphology and inheritance protein 14
MWCIECPQESSFVAWIPGQGVSVDHAAIVEILIQQLDQTRALRPIAAPPSSDFFFFLFSDDEIQQSTALRWILEFLDFAPSVMVPFTPRLIPTILPNLAHHAPAMQSAAVETNQSLFSLIQGLPSPSTIVSPPSSSIGPPVTQPQSVSCA